MVVITPKILDENYMFQDAYHRATISELSEIMQKNNAVILRRLDELSDRIDTLERVVRGTDKDDHAI